MRPAPALFQVALCLSSISSFASASSWPRWLPELDALVVRADASTTPGPTGASNPISSNIRITRRSANLVPSATDQSSASPTGDASKTDGPSTGGDLNTAEPTQSGDTASETGTETGKKTGKATGTKTTKSSKHSTFPPDSPPGGVSMITPNPMLQATPLYKIGDDITWSWNYTSLLGTPTAIDVVASCSVASNTWVVASNMSFETSVNFVWRTKKDAESVENPLLTEWYTLRVQDSSLPSDAAPEPGYLGVWSSFKFGLYTPQPYQPYNEWKCPGKCSASSSIFASQSLGLALSMSALTFLSFTWFVGGLGIY
ncbi:chitinase [Purpureocillium lavendulum]|uniref:Chitinase n=1 Tax=Purpureocillium lavendulum TaxID=1247861 RepID=A0AB34G681_9HYPO|nr:chitinase [Purpureocillium lavendulum]